MNYIHINTIAALLYGVSFFIGQEIDYTLPLQIVGVAYLLFVTPFTLIQAFPLSKKLSAFEIYFSLLIVFFCLYVPGYYILNHSFHFEISIAHTFALNTIILLAVFIVKLFRNKNDTSLSLALPENFLPAIKKESLFIGAMFFYLAFHGINYHLYGFIPEWDSYSDLIKIEQNLKEGFAQQTYRGFFNTSAQILANFSSISPYYIFSIIFIALQSSFIVVLRALLGLYKIKGRLIPFIAYAAAISVPVINMEIDMVRPQNIFILLFPIFLYFAARFLSENRILYAMLAGIIPIAGMNYHEFFVFPLFISAGYLWFSWFRTAYQSDEKKDRAIFLLTTLSAFLLGMLLSQKIGFIDYAISTARNIITHISDFQAWRLWFLGSYSSDGETLQMGWPGISGALKYYAYYLSPALLATLLFLMHSLAKRTTLLRDPVIQAALPLVGVFFLFSEILPRMNYLYLPERLWLPADIALIFAILPILVHLSEKENFKKIICGVSLLFLIGLIGSFYIAMNKKSLTSKSEYRAALWIRENTSRSSVFITQAANGPMIAFFAGRSILPTDPEYFLSDRVIERSPEKEIEKLEDSMNNDFEKVSSLTEEFARNELEFFDFADAIQEKKLSIKTKSKQMEQWKKSIDQPKYVVYSYDKFDTIYQKRVWWRRENFYGADTEKFNRVYPLVYHDGGVYIWKVR